MRAGPFVIPARPIALAPAPLRQNAGPDPRDLVGILEAVARVGAAHAAVVAEHGAALVAPIGAQVPGQDRRAVADVLLDVVHVGATATPAVLVHGHHLHQAAGADEAGRARVAHALDEENGEDGG